MISTSTIIISQDALIMFIFAPLIALFIFIVFKMFEHFKFW